MLTNHILQHCVTEHIVVLPDPNIHQQVHLKFICKRPILSCRDRRAPQTLAVTIRSHPGKPNQKKGQFMNFSRGHSRTNVRCESRLFSQGKTPKFTKMGEIHELFVLALSLVWFAGATPDTTN